MSLGDNRSISELGERFACLFQSTLLHDWAEYVASSNRPRILKVKSSPELIDSRPAVNLSADGDVQKRVLILMADTGGGHRASAEAIKQAFELEFGDKYAVTVVDFWKEHFPWPFCTWGDSYSFLVKNEIMWKAMFYIYKPKLVHQAHLTATAAFVARESANGIRLHRPDVIISVHPLLQLIPLQVLQSMGLYDKIPFTTVVTDLTTCHPTWFHKRTSLCFCPTKEVAEVAVAAGLSQNQLRVHGLPIRPSFSACMSKDKGVLREELGMDPDLPAALLVGGGEGMGPVEAISRALASTLGSSRDAPLGQLVVICGRNKELKATLDAIDWPMPVKVHGFVSNMPDFMTACDCIITKAGPGTIAEALIKGLPMILNGFIAGQEAGNVPFVVENKAGYFCTNPERIAQIVFAWFGPKMKELMEMADNARCLARPEAVINIVRDIDELVVNWAETKKNGKVLLLKGEEEGENKGGKGVWAEETKGKQGLEHLFLGFTSSWTPKSQKQSGKIAIEGKEGGRKEGEKEEEKEVESEGTGREDSIMASISERSQETEDINGASSDSLNDLLNESSNDLPKELLAEMLKDTSTEESSSNGEVKKDDSKDDKTVVGREGELTFDSRMRGLKLLLANSFPPPLFVSQLATPTSCPSSPPRSSSPFPSFDHLRTLSASFSFNFPPTWKAASSPPSTPPPPPPATPSEARATI
eukprot:TRINITY_DN482_c0_g1_i1.p1 TRINITY_DN482_c0_g1~~TRINITY_DN482_c0_g1_i1.p1  ORF type:complete len:701 (+),score=161.55 TRINITY_DN482_c0_g1_i1:132-2234(+)